jgi:hypothetical protein
MVHYPRYRFRMLIMRTNIAIGICVVSALLLGYFCVFQGYSPVEGAVDLWVIWFQVASWLGDRQWMLGLKPREIYGEAKRGSLKLTGVALTIERASFVFLGAALIMWLIRR